MSSTPPNWRSNTLAVSSDTNPTDGMTFDNWITGADGKAKQLFPRDAGAITAIPTGGVSITSIGAAYLYYMDVTDWSTTPWKCSYSSAVKSTDGGQNWTRLTGLTWGSPGNFNQVAIYKSGGYVYFFGIPCGRTGEVKLMRVLEGSIENKAAYEYLTGYDASNNPIWAVNAESSAVTVVGAQVGELSVRWDAYIGQYIMMHLHDVSPYTIELRSSPNLWGPWSSPQTVTTGDTYPCLYAPYMREGYDENNGQTIYFRMSRYCPGFNPYSTYWMKMTLNAIVPSPTPTPSLVDSDGDGCSDAQELGSDWKLGGQRDPNNKWDFWDVPVPPISATNWNLPVGDPKRPKMDHAITVQDAQAVWAYYGTKKGGPANAAGYSYDTHYGYQMGLTDDPNFTDGMFYDRSPSTDQTQFWRTNAPRGIVGAATAQLEMSLYSRGGSNCN